MDAHLKRINEYVDEHQDLYIQRLSDIVAIKSVSAWPEVRGEVFRVVKETGDKLKELGATIELAENGTQTLPDGKVLDLPPVLFASLGSDPKKKTLLIYGHLDVQPATIEDGWDTEPFVLTEKSGNLYGRGSTDDKGPVIAWLNCIEAFQKLDIDIPINLKFCLEGMEESGSEGLDQRLAEKKDTFLNDVDYVCISDNYWLGKDKPCITYGLRGICYFFIEVSCADKDLHSGVFGGSVHEAMSDLIYLMNSLVDKNGKILVPGVMDTVAPMTEEEEKLYPAIDFDPEDFAKDIGTSRLLHDSKEKLLQHRWRFPSLSLHGIEGAFDGTGAKTVIPRKVIGKFSIRLVPDQDPEDISAKVVEYVEKLHKERGTPNIGRCVHFHGGRPWMSDPTDPHFIAGKRATQRIWNKEPDLTREGGSIPVTLTLQRILKSKVYSYLLENDGGFSCLVETGEKPCEAHIKKMGEAESYASNLKRLTVNEVQDMTGKNVMLLPMGQCDDGAHSQNEKFSRRNYMNGIKLAAAYFLELAAL